MLSVRKRGKFYRLEGRISGQRIRVALGTRHHDAAMLMSNRIERAFSEGGESALWPEIQRALPKPSFKTLARVSGYVEKASPDISTWEELMRDFRANDQIDLAQGILSPSTVIKHEKTIKNFTEYLRGVSLERLKDIDTGVIAGFKAWRLPRILSSPSARTGGALDIDIQNLKHMFNFAIEREVVLRNPVRGRVARQRNTAYGAQPFTGLELGSLR